MLTQHYNDVRVLVNKGVVSDSFAKKMAEQFPDRSNIAINEIRKFVNVEILCQEHPISHIKTFGSLHCSLFTKEKLKTLEVLKKQLNIRMNSKRTLWSMQTQDEISQVHMLHIQCR